jgi:hypothetical protein
MAYARKFQDAMDPSRFIKVNEFRHGKAYCSVYFEMGKSKVYHGKTELPAYMFEQNARNQRSGFIAI